MLRVIEIRDAEDRHHLTRDEIMCCGTIMVVNYEGTCLYLRSDGSLRMAVVTLEEIDG